MAGPGNGARRYAVHCAGAITEEIRRVHHLASRQGRGKAVTRAFRQIITRQKHSPFQVGYVFGDMRYS